MKNLSVKKLIENRWILFAPLAYLYLGIMMFAMDSLALTLPEWQTIICFSAIPVVLSQGKTTYDVYSKQNVEKSIFILSWILTILAICFMAIYYFIKFAS